MESITDADYTHAKVVCKVFEIINLAEYHDSYVKIYTLLLACVLQNFTSRCIKKCELGTAKFPSAPGLAWQAVSKATKVKLDLLNGINVMRGRKTYKRRNMSLCCRHL